MSSKIIKVRHEDKEVTLYTYALSILLSWITGTCFAIMMTSTFKLGLIARGSDFVISSMIFSIGVTLILTRKNKYITTAFMTAVPILFTLMIVFNIFNLQDAVFYLFSSIEKMTYFDFGIKSLKAGRNALTGLLVCYNFLVVTVTCFVVVYRRSPVWVFISVAPFFLTSIIITYRLPSLVATLLAIFASVALIILGRVRKAPRKDSERTVLMICLPVFVLVFIIGISCSLNNKNGQAFAKKGIRQVRRVVLTTVSNRKVNKILNDLFYAAEFGRTPEGDSLSTLSGLIGGISKSEDLHSVGNLSLPEIVVAKVVVKNNPITNPYNENCGALYLRSLSLDQYSQNLWTASEAGNNLSLDIYDSEARYLGLGTVIYQTEDGFTDGVLVDGSGEITIDFTDENVSYDGIRNSINLSEQADYITSYDEDFGLEEGRFGLEVISSVSSACVPYYSDMYMFDGVFNESTLNLIPDPYAQASQAKILPFNTAPVKKPEGFYNLYDTYLVSVCLSVPAKTQTDIINSGVLPDWYLDVYYGRTEMTDAEKVRAVNKFVSGLHPYDELTPYPPDDEDFVLWFLTEADSGFCVHYATTEVILLRMLGVPARYASGYLIDEVTLNYEMEVMSTDAHAWVEVFFHEFGWILDDPTPGNGLPASNYNLDSIGKYYSEYKAPANQAGITDVPAEQAAITPTPDPLNDPEMAKDLIEEQLNISAHPFLYSVGISVVSAIVLLAVLRLSYVIFWNIKFRRGTVNDRARVYYHYFELVLGHMNYKPDNNVRSLAEIAAFSDREMTKEELEKMVKAGESQIRSSRTQRSFLDKFVSDLLAID